MIIFELDIPSITSGGLEMESYGVFENVKELISSSMVDELIIIEMLILLTNSFDRKARYQRIRVLNKSRILLHSILILRSSSEPATSDCITC